MKQQQSKWEEQGGSGRSAHASRRYRLARDAAGIGVILAATLLGITAGCTRVQMDKGLEPTWQAVDADTFRIGASTQSEVLAALGPPSQIIAGKDGDIFYYLHEQATGTGVIFIVYNQLRLTTRYDRAVFFFDSAGVLQDYSVSSPPQPPR